MEFSSKSCVLYLYGMNCIKAVFQWCMPSFCPQEKETAHPFLVSLLPMQCSKADRVKGWELQYFCVVYTWGKNKNQKPYLFKQILMQVIGKK